MSGMGLTIRQGETLAALRKYTEENGRSPTCTELCEAMGSKSRGLVHRWLEALRERGHIDWVPRRTQSIVILDQQQTFTLPLKVALALAQFCAAHNERSADVVADAVALHLDATEKRAEERHA